MSPKTSSWIIRWTLTLSTYNFTMYIFTTNPLEMQMHWVAYCNPRPQCLNDYLETLCIYCIIYQLQLSMHLILDEGQIQTSSYHRSTNSYYKCDLPYSLVINFNNFQVQGWIEYTWWMHLVWGSRVIIPLIGANRMKSLARAYNSWLKMDKDTEDLTKSCLMCQQTSAHSAKVLLCP